VILPPDQARRIYRGERTTIRIPVDPRLTNPRPVVRRKEARPFVPTLGMRLSLGHDIRADITGIRREQLGNLTDEQAQAEGYPDADEFVTAWVLQHDREWISRQLRYLEQQGVPEEEANATVPGWAELRYPDRWETADVWVITVTAAHDIDLFLTAASRPKGSELGHTPSESEALDAGRYQDPAKIHPEWAKRADRRHAKARTEAEKRARARALQGQVRSLALADDPITDEIERLLQQQQDQAA
jgi:hypothetical protein